MPRGRIAGMSAAKMTDGVADEAGLTSWGQVDIFTRALDLPANLNGL